MEQAEAELRRRAQEIRERLGQAYGEPAGVRDLDPVSELVSTILSQNTNDANRDVAFSRLRLRFPTWDDVLQADTEAVVDAIRPAGLANQKAPWIQDALRAIIAERGELELEFLRDRPVSEAKAWLSSLQGVGPKTAAIVLLFALGRPAFPVDTHVHRVSGRLGLIGPRVTREKAHDLLEDLIPPEHYYSFHLNLIRHGRQICQARRPRCEACFLTDLCDYYRQVVAPAQPAAVQDPE
ncbi:MAG TPA: endonuclease III [Anaerolineae bacterium]|nr:endonuclease III [Anaerolineae bacterium]